MVCLGNRCINTLQERAKDDDDDDDDNNNNLSVTYIPPTCFELYKVKFETSRRNMTDK
jgi:hypothetical protein